MVAPHSRATTIGMPATQVCHLPHRRQAQTASGGTRSKPSNQNIRGTKAGVIPCMGWEVLATEAGNPAGAACNWPLTMVASASRVRLGAQPLPHPAPSELTNVISATPGRTFGRAGEPFRRIRSTRKTNVPCAVVMVMRSPFRRLGNPEKGPPKVVLRPNMADTPGCPGSGVSARCPGPFVSCSEFVPSTTTAFRKPRARMLRRATGTPGLIAPPSGAVSCASSDRSWPYRRNCVPCSTTLVSTRP